MIKNLIIIIIVIIINAVAMTKALLLDKRINSPELAKIFYDITIPNLLYSAKVHASENVKLAILAGQNIEIKDSNGKTPLVIATENNFTDIVNILIDSGADVNIKDNENRTALSYSMQNSNLDLSDKLIDLGVGIDKEDKVFPNLFVNLSDSGNEKFIKNAIKAGYDVNTEREGEIPMFEERSALAAAVQSNFADIVKILLDAGANINTKLKNGKNVDE